MAKIVAVNAGPRKGWNTDILVKEAAAGAPWRRKMPLAAPGHGTRSPYVW